MQLRTNPLIRLAQADMVFYLLPALMALLIAGTVSQHDMGLYASHQMFFASFMFWAGPVPLPGGYTLLGLLTLNLAVKFILESEWSLRKTGIILTHLGVLVLLAGGLVTAIYAKEGFMIIAEGAESPYVYDYHKRDLSIFMGDYASMTVPFENLRKGHEIPGLNFKLRILDSCENCAIIKREEAPETSLTPHGMAQHMALQSKRPEQNPEDNLAGITFEVSGLGDQDGLYIAFDAMPKPLEFKHNNQDYRLILGRRQQPLPFSLKLIDFTKEPYPGTDTARAYTSDMVIKDGTVEWPATISMNEPLRYKGYTFYQSSFDQNGTSVMTVLSVVENRGRLFPYTGTALVAAGLLLHIFLTLRGKKA